jgi:hypothetical protein
MAIAGAPQSLLMLQQHQQEEECVRTPTILTTNHQLLFALTLSDCPLRYKRRTALTEGKLWDTTLTSRFKTQFKISNIWYRHDAKPGNPVLRDLEFHVIAFKSGASAPQLSQITGATRDGKLVVYTSAYTAELSTIFMDIAGDQDAAGLCLQLQTDSEFQMLSQRDKLPLEYMLPNQLAS